jgi:hypothetical protein
MSRVIKGEKSERVAVSTSSSSVKQHSQDRQSRIVKGRHKQLAVIKEKKWTSGSHRLGRKIYKLSGIIVKCYNC